ncbi:MAG: Nif3-like dinuclear metal center hexameric protein [Bacillota bacterium]
MSLKCGDIINLIEELAHPRHAESWDKIGLQIGDPATAVNKVLVSLDVTPQLVQEAVQEGVDLIVTHHTPFFNPLESIRWDKPLGQIVQKLVQSNINLYCAHTNLDSVQGGVSDVLADKIGLQDVSVLAPSWQEKYFKVVVFVPWGYEDQVRSAMGAQGAGHIGNYADCTFQLFGTGTFRPLEGTNPFIGSQGQLEKAEEFRLETIVPESQLPGVIEAMKAAHPYEEVAYDVYPLANKFSQSGLGRIGYLGEELTLEQLLRRIGGALNTQDLRFVGNKTDKIKKAAVCGGSGASLINAARKQNADVFITGDIKYHEAQEAQSMGLALIDAGHFATEFPVVKVVADFLRSRLAADIKVIESQVNTNPFEFYKG